MFNQTINNILDNNSKPTWKCPAVSLSPEAISFIKQFIHYAELDMEGMADLMYYDYDGFKSRLARLKKEIDYKKECD